LYVNLCLVRNPTKRESFVTNKVHKFIASYLLHCLINGLRRSQAAD
jgi:hypothetical protein